MNRVVSQLLQVPRRRCEDALVEQPPHLLGCRAQAVVLGIDQADRVANACMHIVDDQVGIVVANDLFEGFHRPTVNSRF